MMQPKGVEVTIDRLEETGAVVRTDQGEEFVLPLSLLPPESGEGSRLWLSVSPEKKDEASREEVARDLLRQILNKSQ
jgi:hypothetical protein